VPDTITPAMDKAELYQTTRRRFMAHLQYTRGYPKTTCYNYHSDLNLWAAWLGLAGVDWTDAHHTDVEAFIGWQMRERGVPHLRHPLEGAGGGVAGYSRSPGAC